MFFGRAQVVLFNAKRVARTYCDLRLARVGRRLIEVHRVVCYRPRDEFLWVRGLVNYAIATTYFLAVNVAGLPVFSKCQFTIHARGVGFYGDDGVIVYL